MADFRLIQRKIQQKTSSNRRNILLCKGIGVIGIKLRHIIGSAYNRQYIYVLLILSLRSSGTFGDVDRPDRTRHIRACDQVPDNSGLYSTIHGLDPTGDSRRHLSRDVARPINSTCLNKMAMMMMMMMMMMMIVDLYRALRRTPLLRQGTCSGAL